MKKVLFVMNTLSRAGAETALLEVLKQAGKKDTDISLYVLTGIGELKNELPPEVHLLNRVYSEASVLSKEGRRILRNRVLSALFQHGTILKRSGYLLRNFVRMLGKGRLLPDKLLWRILADGAERFDEEFDLAVAYIEGGSTYYTADYVKAKEKYAFVHISYAEAGYDRSLDGDCYAAFDRIYTVSEEIKRNFEKVYPEYADKLYVNENAIDVESIENKSLEKPAITIPEEEFVILTVARLTEQKALDVSAKACALLKEKEIPFRWYVLGEGAERKKLEKLIGELDLADTFLLPGAVDNPYPFMRRADLYVHASKYEGKSIALTEAKLLGCPVIVSDTDGNREQIENGVDGIFCKLTPESISEEVSILMQDQEKRIQLGKAARERALAAVRKTGTDSFNL